MYYVFILPYPFGKIIINFKFCVLFTCFALIANQSHSGVPFLSVVTKKVREEVCEDLITSF